MDSFLCTYSVYVLRFFPCTHVYVECGETVAALKLDLYLQCFKYNSVLSSQCFTVWGLVLLQCLYLHLQSTLFLQEGTF